MSADAYQRGERVWVRVPTPKHDWSRKGRSRLVQATVLDNTWPPMVLLQTSPTERPHWLKTTRLSRTKPVEPLDRREAKLQAEAAAFRALPDQPFSVSDVMKTFRLTFYEARSMLGQLSRRNLICRAGKGRWQKLDLT